MSFAGSATYNLFARFTFSNASAMKGMRQTKKQFDGMYGSAKRMKAGMSMMAGGMTRMATVGGVAALAIGGIVKEGATFEKQMSVVKSIVTKGGNVTVKNFAAMEKEALRLGRTTSFTAVQAAQGMEQLSRAGFSAKEVMDATKYTLKLAEADSIQLATASDIVASSIRAFKMEAGEAQTVADSLAYTSATSNTNVTALGESMRYAASIAKTSGVTFKETVAALGMLGDIGLKGSIAGTALKNALLKINKPSKKVMKIFGGKKGWSNIMQEFKGGRWVLKSFQDRFAGVMDKIRKFKTPAERSAALMEVFGLRGIATAGAIDSFGLAVTKTGDPTKTFKARLDALNTSAKGTAEKMADMRLKNLAGQWTLFKSAVSGAAIQIYKSFGPKLTPILKNFTGWVSRLGEAISLVAGGTTEKAIAANNRYGRSMADLIFGIKEGAIAAWSAFKTMGKGIIWVLQAMGFESDKSNKGVIKLITKFIMLSAFMAPVIAAFGALKFAASGAFAVIRGMFMFISGGAGFAAAGIKKLANAMGGGAAGKAATGASRALGSVGKGLVKFAGFLAQPVYVVNMKGGGLGGVGDLLGGGKKAGAGGGILSKFFRGGGAARTLGGRTLGGMGRMFAASSSAFGAIGAFTLALIPAIAGIKALGKAYTPAEQKKYRKNITEAAKRDSTEGYGPMDYIRRLLEPHGFRDWASINETQAQKEAREKKRIAYRKKWNLIKTKNLLGKAGVWGEELSGLGGKAGGITSTAGVGALRRRGLRAGMVQFRDSEKKGNGLWKYKGNVLGGAGMSAALRQSDALSAEMLNRLFMAAGGGTGKGGYKGFSAAKAGIELKQLALLQLLVDKTKSDEEVAAVANMLNMLEALAKRPTVITIDGKEIAIANDTSKNEGKKRGKGGKPKKNAPIAAGRG